ncbi:tRNA(Met) cytidine acetyltransferase TmcA [Vibrio renipiscarius]|uniref:tRNA(Met) cytidine acetyltransferase TmcA n=1 Tax=Vibrio renipiscarius TaxID=1461322 RepID=UPI00069960EF|nr:GNAT family N-acetyltransferase [Vibrio renipiscarius]
MTSLEHSLSSLVAVAQQRNHRFGLTVKGLLDWQNSVCETAIRLFPSEVIQLGGEALSGVSRCVPYNKGQQLLGQECALLIIDCRDAFDANSITSALGILRGGGLAIFITSAIDKDGLSEAWLKRALHQLIVIEQDSALPTVSQLDEVGEQESSFSQQQEAVTRIEKVLTGHRRRPLVLTADRGRGKTSALGIAAATLIKQRKMRIIVTSPSVNSVTPLFEHAQRLLPQSERSKFALVWQQSSIEFVAPDELLLQKPSCDLLLVDEASSLPLPLLFAMVDHYHRAVFSTTIHGYEGCGRGFTVKFQSWLRTNRPGTAFFHMDMPIRWAKADPLEEWQYATFLLDTELAEVDETRSVIDSMRYIAPQTLFQSPDLLRQCFALLVNAHYQTTPNDLMLLLSDSSMKLFALFSDDICVGCVIGVEEGGLSAELVSQIQQGIRRPKGHLVATTLANHLGNDVAAQQLSLRIMRIAVHPQLQGRGMGSALLRELEVITRYSFYSTSFGATDTLLRFWAANGYQPVKLGSQRDQASGCHSLVMVKGNQDWVDEAKQLFFDGLSYQLKDALVELDPLLSAQLLSLCLRSVDTLSAVKTRLVNAYIKGGSNYENVSPFIEALLQQQIDPVSSPLIIRKVIQQWSWTRCAAEFGFTGRKQVEKALRDELALYLACESNPVPQSAIYSVKRK